MTDVLLTEYDTGINFDNSYARLPKVFYTKTYPVSVTKPQIAVFNENLAEALGLKLLDLDESERAALLVGNRFFKGSEPLAQAYAGHQFGYFTMLGDGRAHLLGEHLTPDKKRLDIQLKGSGRTPYSRRGDGRAAIGPMLREYIISEAMHFMGIPSTRSLAVIYTGESVIRENSPLLGAVLVRVADSHIRVGTFEYAAALKDKELLKILLDYTVERHYPHIAHENDKALAFLTEVIKKQTDLIVHWMRVGFIHGVMNTDNIAISGETIDYGPCAFMDSYNSDTVFSSIDHLGRYAFGNQPLILQWNLARLAETLLPLLDNKSENALLKAEEALQTFNYVYKEKRTDMMRHKLGLSGEQNEDETLIADLLDWMQQTAADYTNTFRDLCSVEMPSNNQYQDGVFRAWHKRWRQRLEKNSKPLIVSQKIMRETNPAIIPRNHKVQQVLEAAEGGDLKPLEELLSALKNPYHDQKALKLYQTPPMPSERIRQTFCGT